MRKKSIQSQPPIQNRFLTRFWIALLLLILVACDTNRSEPEFLSTALGLSFDNSAQTTSASLSKPLTTTSSNFLLNSGNTLNLPLSADGRYIVDNNQNRFKLKSVNWYGASDTKYVVAGLDKQPIEHIVSLIQEWGFNSVRLPFSNLMIHSTTPVSNDAVAANPQFYGKTPLEIYDATVNALSSAGILVILNNHTTFSEWCCGYDYNGLWYHTGSTFAYNQTTEMWQADWLTMVRRYKTNPLVAGADLRNEVRTMRKGDTHIPDSPNWGSNDVNDWHKASQDLGALITKENSNLLVIVEGINWWGLIPILGSGERPHLKPIKDLPIHLPLSNKLVYAAHNYAYIGPNHNGDDSTSNGNIKYKEMDENTFLNTIQNEWGYVATPEMYYSAPVWVSEFGVSPSNSSAQDKEWFRRLVTFLIEKDLDFAYWPLNGNDEWGLLSSDWSRTLKDDWRFEHLNRLLSSSGRIGSVQENHYSNLTIGNGNDNASTLYIDWDNGANKGTCPDGFRMNGLSTNQKALCTDQATGNLWASNRNYNVQAVYETGTRYHGNGDWAGGFTKYECPQNFYVAGFSKRNWGTSGILCSESKIVLSNSCRTVWFDRGDNRSSNKGGDWAYGSYKGQCGDSEYVGGIAQRNGGASALLCCQIRNP
ncbi:glycosyl hydrolase family 5 [Leptospira tipperaryensis]|uniref:Glycosyl hydrolase family 5 n=1 Tax=Leptospira tipperaryensis TaxID=2564040 RepID=A0A1D7UX80_9LEPT|nr:cellulase family glycosylhydrolase [Leptospira tipperaryensis]AOP34192.1 glycosyl hydrolase family 5 [Leptospira tipperaryensis]